MVEKNIVIINPNFPGWKNEFVEALKQEGNPCLGITDDLSNLDISRFKWLYRANMSGDRDSQYYEFERAVRFFRERFGDIGLIESFEEHWKAFEAKLREKFYISGRRTADYREISSKEKAKQRFVKAGVPVAISTIPKTREECERFLRRCNERMIAKPDNGVGANGVVRVFHKRDIDKINLDGRIILEEFLEGEIVSYDALVDANGDIVDAFCLKYTPLDLVVSGRAETAIFVLKDIPEEFDRLGRRCVKEFGSNGEFVHIEFMKTRDGRYYGMDANLRICGAYAPYLYNIVGRERIEERWAKVVLGKKVGENRHEQYAGLFSRRNDKEYRLNGRELERELSTRLAYVVDFPHIMTDCLNNEGYFVMAKSVEELEGIKKLVQD